MYYMYSIYIHNLCIYVYLYLVCILPSPIKTKCYVNKEKKICQYHGRESTVAKE